MKIMEKLKIKNSEEEIKNDVYYKVKFIVGKYGNREYLNLYNKNIIQKNNIHKLNTLQNKLKTKMDELNENTDTLIEKNNILVDELKNTISNLF